jgi:putative phosphoribosyl transferase
MMFRDREQAGRRLAELLREHRGKDPVVLALPRGGVPVAVPVAEALGAPLDVLVARKLGAPFQPEYALGAIAEGGARVADPDALREAGVDDATLEALVAREEAELHRRVRRYRGKRALPPLRGRTVIVVDDGVATGRTARAALRAARALGAGRLLLAAPVIAASTAAALRAEGDADEVVAVTEPDLLDAVGSWYERFEQVEDDEVVALLASARRSRREER